jgi:hypothetical protein
MKRLVELKSRFSVNRPKLWYGLNMNPKTAEKPTKILSAFGYVSIALLASCVSIPKAEADKIQSDTRGGSLERFPPGPECPPGEFMAGTLPHYFCMDEDLYASLAGGQK